MRIDDLRVGFLSSRLSALGRRRRALEALTASAIAAFVLMSALLATSPATAHAEEPVTVTPAEVATALFVAGDVGRLSELPSGTEDIVLEKALQQMYADEPGLSPEKAEEYVHQMEAMLASPSAPSNATLQMMAGNQRIIAIIAALERPSGSSTTLPPAARLALTHLAAIALAGSSNVFVGAEEPKYFEPLADTRTNLTYTTFAPANVLRATRALAAANRSFGQARNALWAKASEESVFSEWEALLHESKILRSEAMKQLREAVEAGHGTLTESPAKLTGIFTEGQLKTEEQSCAHGGSEEEIGTASIEGVPRLKCSGGALYEAAKAPRTCSKECKEELERRQSLAAERERAIAEERARMVAAAELLRPSDNTAAALQDATAAAQAQITEEEVAYADYEAEKADKEAIAGGVKAGLEAGTGVLALATGNYSEGLSGLIGVGFELYEGVEGGLSHPPPGPQEITLQDLANISTQLSGFQQYTQQAFHAINTQLAQLSAQLAQENYELKQEIAELGEHLQREQATIYALQDEVQTLFATQTKANLQQTIEDSVGWLRRTGEPLSPTRFQEALVALKKDATEIANGALVNNAETQPYSFEGAFRQLTSKSSGEPANLSEDISYLARFPTEQEWVASLPPPSLPNTTFWSESSRAYAQLMLENASYVTSADVSGLGGLEREGSKLARAQAAWSANSAASGSPTGNTILDRALGAVEAAAFGTGVQGAEAVGPLLQRKARETFETALKKLVTTNSSTSNPTGLNLWGGAEQPFNVQEVYKAEYPALKWSECAASEGANGAAQMPESFIESLPSAFVNAVRLGVIGAPKSGAPLILEACRTITNFKPEKAEDIHPESAEKRIYCPNSANTKACEVVATYKTTWERNNESVTETLRLSEGSSKTYTLASPASCKQSALYWSGGGELYAEDAELKTRDSGLYESKSSEPRTVGTVHLNGVALSQVGKEDKVTWGPELERTPEEVFEGSSCPREGTEQTAGREYANYGFGESPLGSGSGGMEASTLIEDVNARLRQLQEEAYKADLEVLANPPKGDPAESLAGAKALLQSYIRLGLPQAVASNLALQSDVQGIGAQFLDPEPGSPRPLPAQLNALIDSWTLKLTKAAESGQSALTVALAKNPIEEVHARVSAWTKEVATLVKPYVEQQVGGFKGSSGPEPLQQQSALVESTVNRMQLTHDVLSEARAPNAETLAPANIDTAEATLRGEVDPNGGAVESCLFEYGATTSYGERVPCSSTPSANEKAVVVSATISNWTPEGSFHERVVLKTWGGTSYGEDVKVQLAQSTRAPSGGLIIASTDTSGATLGGFGAEPLPPAVTLPAGAVPLVGMLHFTVNVTPGGSARVKIELPSGELPTVLYKLRRTGGGAEQYVEVPSSLYTISSNTIELTLVDGGPEDEDGEANGVIVDPLVPVRISSLTGAIAPPTLLSPAPAAVPPTSSTHPTRKRRLARPSRACLRGGLASLQIGAYLRLPAGVSVLRGEIISHGRVIAMLRPGASGALISLGAARKTASLTIIARLSNGHMIRRQVILHGCSFSSPPAQLCVRGHSVALDIGTYLRLPAGVRVVRSEILLGKRMIARLGGQSRAVLLNLAALRRPPYRLTITASLSNHRTRRRMVILRSCVAGNASAHRPQARRAR